MLAESETAHQKATCNNAGVPSCLHSSEFLRAFCFYHVRHLAFFGSHIESQPPTRGAVSYRLSRRCYCLPAFFNMSAYSKVGSFGPIASLPKTKRIGEEEEKNPACSLALCIDSILNHHSPFLPKQKRLSALV